MVFSITKRKSNCFWFSGFTFFPELLLAHCRQTPRLGRQRDAVPGNSPLERSHELELDFFPGDRGVRVVIQVPEALLDKSFSRISQRHVIQPFVLG
jgi:hypothetical protein